MYDFSTACILCLLKEEEKQSIRIDSRLEISQHEFPSVYFPHVVLDVSKLPQASGLETAVARLRDELGELRAAPVTGPAKTWG